MFERGVLLVVSFLALSLFLGCTSSSGYRQSEETTVEDLLGEVALAHVEIDDQGELIRFEQLRRVTDRIKAESSEPLLLLVYVHGWNRNSSEKLVTGAKDLLNFRKKLTEVSKVSERKVMGVFVSWRGRSLSPFPVGIDYFHRHAAARRAGGLGGTEVLYELGGAARAANSRNRVVMIGHSLGGAMLESAVGEAVAGQVVSRHARGLRLRRRDFPADLFITVNSAESAIAARQLVSVFKNRGIQEVEGGPLLVSLTSEEDTITSYFSPLGNIIGRWVPGFNFFNTGVSGRYRVDEELDPKRGTQAAAHRTTVGHFDPLFSHRYVRLASELKVDGVRELVLANQRPSRKGGFLVRSEGENFFYEGVPGAYNDTPYWVVPVPRSILKGHSDQWNDAFTGMMTVMIALSRE